MNLESQDVEEQPERSPSLKSGWQITGERPLTDDELALLHALARRCRRFAVIAGIGTVIAFVGWIAGMMAAAGMIGKDSGLQVLTLIFAPVTLGAVFYLWRQDSARRSAGLRRDIARGAAVQYEGRTIWAVFPIPFEHHLQLEGVLNSDANVLQTLEVLPESRAVWSANGTRPSRVRFEADPASLLGERIPGGELDGRTPGETRPALAKWFWSVVWWWCLSSMVTPSLSFHGPFALRYALGAGIALLGIVLVVGVHEAGHLIAGWATGMRFVRCRIGPTSIERTCTGLRIGWSGIRQYDSGWAQMSVDDEGRFRFRYGLMGAGGPVASIIVAIALGVASGRVWLPAGDPSAGNAALRLFAMVAITHALVSSIPMWGTPSGFITDAGLLRWLWSDPAGAAHVAVCSVLEGRIRSGQRPRDWDPDLLARASRDPFGRLNQWVNLMDFYHCSDSGRWDQAIEVLNAGVEACDYPYAHLEAAFYQGFHARDAGLARAELNAVGERGVGSDARRAEAAVLLAEGDFEGARAAAEEGLRGLRWEVGAGLAAAKEEWLRTIISECDSESPTKDASRGQ